MKKFLILCTLIISLVLTYDIAFYRLGLYINFNSNKEIETFTKVNEKKILIKKGDNFEEFEIKGIDLGAGIPGKFATDYAIDKDTYIKWFKQMQEMGANTIRVYTVLGDEFYNAFYEFNKDNDNPMYLIHGLWVNDYVQFSSKNAFDNEFKGKMLKDSKILVDILHGNKKISPNKEYGNGTYKKDISPWVIGYILGVEWEDVTVEYTNQLYKKKNSYNGKYMYTTENATPFEAMLANVGDKLIEYESDRYKQQKLVAFSNWPTTDPFDYSEEVTEFYRKMTKVDVEHIKLTDKVISGTFASYHVYPYYPDYLSYEGDINQYVDENGKINTYRAYLKKLVDYHSIPVMITEYGVPSSRGMTQRDKYTGRNQGGMSESEQAEAVISCYNDIKASGCCGSIVFTWQDEWFKRTWNTMKAVNLNKTAYWSDYQTCEQYFGILSFDPGNEKSICYVDGNAMEWNEEDKVITNEDMSLSIKYDEKFIYFLVNKQNYTEDTKLYIPIDLTPKTGSNYCSNFNIKFDQNADFILNIDGKDNSRLLVQERYELLRAMSNRDVEGESAYSNIPDKNTNIFKNINLLLQTATPLETGDNLAKADVFETGKLVYGNANPDSTEYNSMADFCINGDNIEIKIPWQLLNFSNPSEMMIHDDYYENYGVEEIKINKMYVGIGSNTDTNLRIPMSEKTLKGWGSKVTYHERLKKVYYSLQEIWTK